MRLESSTVGTIFDMQRVEPAKEVGVVAVWQCSLCGFEQEGRCKPRKCTHCGGKDSFAKKEEPGAGKPVQKAARKKAVGT